MSQTVKAIAELERFVDVYDDRVVLNLPGIDGPIILKDWQLEYCFAYPEYVKELTPSFEEWDEMIPNILRIRERKRNFYDEFGLKS